MAVNNAINSTINSTTSGIVSNDANGVMTSTATTNHAIQIGNASGTLASVAGSNNTGLNGSTGADPSFGAIPVAALTSNTFSFSGSNAAINSSGSPVTLGNSVTINMTGEGTPWTQVTTTNMASNNGYFVVGSGGAVNELLPSSSAVGDVVYVITRATRIVNITQGSGQQIFFNATHTTLGTGGNLSTASGSDATITLVCSGANTTWWAFDITGTWTVT